MSEQQDRNIEDLKAQERIEIPVEEEETPRDKSAKPDVSEALSDLGRQFAETMKTAWNSQERKEFESEVREGVRRFGDEVNKVFSEARQSPTAKKVREEAGDARARVESGEVGRKARSGLVEGLQWMSQELARLADQFSSPETPPEETGERPTE